jgi:hypothetical protein
MARKVVCILAILMAANQVLSFQYHNIVLFKRPVNHIAVSKRLSIGPKCQEQNEQTTTADLGKVSLASALAGPGHPYPFPRTVTQVVAFSLPTALGWYGW